MKKYLLLFLCSILLVTGCGGKAQQETSKSRKIKVVTTMFAAYDFVRAVGGDKVHVTMLVPPGADIHAFEPTPKDIIGLEQCDVLVYVGGESDGWVEKILTSINNKKMQKIKMLSVVKPVEEEIKAGMTVEKEEHKETRKAADDKEYDEHVWTSPRNAGLIAQVLRDTFVAKDSSNKKVYEKNYAQFHSQLDELDKQFKEIVAQGKRKEIIFGDRFPLRYFVDAYGLSYYAAFPGCAHNTEASAGTIAFLMNKVKADKIPVVFHIELSNEKIAKAICEGTGAKMRQFNTCHNLSKKDFDSGKTYLELMKENLSVLKEALN